MFPQWKASIRITRPRRSDRPFDDNAPFSALAFKIMTDPFVGQLTFIRIYSGNSSRATPYYTLTRPQTSALDACSKMHANKREEITTFMAGDICAASD